MSRSDDKKMIAKEFPFVYTGPSTKWGLKKNDRCKKLKKRAGGIVIQTPNRRTFIVGPTQLEKP